MCFLPYFQTAQCEWSRSCKHGVKVGNIQAALTTVYPHHLSQLHHHRRHHHYHYRMTLWWSSSSSSSYLHLHLLTPLSCSFLFLHFLRCSFNIPFPAEWVAFLASLSLHGCVVSNNSSAHLMNLNPTLDPFLMALEKLQHSLEPRNNPRTFRCTGCLTGILTMVYHNPHISLYSKIPYIPYRTESVFFIAHFATKAHNWTAKYIACNWLWWQCLHCPAVMWKESFQSWYTTTNLG